MEEADLEVEVYSAFPAGGRSDETFEDFYHREYGNLVALAYALSGNQAGAPDLALDGFVVTSRRWDSLDGLPDTYVRRLVARAAVDRRRQIAAAARARAHRRHGPSVPTPDAEAWAAVRQLGRRPAQVVALHVLEDRPVDEIAHILEADPSHVAICLRDALNSLTLRFAVKAIEDAAAHLRHATDIPPPPIRRTTTVTRCIQVAVAALVAVVIIAATVTDDGAHNKTAAPVTAGQTEAATIRFVENLAGGRDRAAQQQLSPTLRPVFDPLALQVQWQHVLRAFGTFRSVAPPLVSAVGNSPELSVSAVVLLARGQVGLGLEFTTAGKIETFGFESEPAPGDEPTTDSLLSAAAATIRTLAAGNYQAVMSERDPLAAASTVPANLPRRWQGLERAYGAFKGVGIPTISVSDAYSVNLPIHWARADSSVIVAFDSTGQLDHFVFLRADAPPDALLGEVVSRSPIAQSLAAEAVADLRAGRDVDLARGFNSLGAPSATSDQLGGEWRAATARLGRLRHVDSPVFLGSNQAIVAFEIGLSFDHGRAHVQVSIDNREQYQDLLIEPGPPTRQFGQ
jgi:RNA polymerase sigma-70 factor (ECF subfamily)